MLTRRRLLGLCPPMFVGACSSGTPPGVRLPSSGRVGEARHRLVTPLGDVELAVPASAWIPWATTVERSAAQVARVWGKAPRPIRLTVGSAADLAASADGIGAETVGVTNAQGEVIVAASAEQTLTPLGRQVVVAHELVHARLAQHGPDRTALWVKEGAAEWSATPPQGAPAAADRWPVLRRARTDNPSRFAGPPTSDVFVDETKLAYEWAAAYVTYLVAVSGQEEVKHLVLSRPREVSAAHAAALLPRRSGATSFAHWLHSTLSP